MVSREMTGKAASNPPTRGRRLASSLIKPTKTPDTTILMTSCTAGLDISHVVVAPGAKAAKGSSDLLPAVLAFDVRDLVDAGVVGGIGFVGRREPGVQNLGCPRFRDTAQAQADHVGLVPAARPDGRFRIVTQRSADAGHFVGGNRDARARPAEQDALVGAARRHV